MKTEKSCNNCIYSIPDWTNVCNSDHYCSNEESEEYGYNAEYLNGCEEWKSIEPNLGNNGSICTKTGVNDEDRIMDDLISRQAVIDAINALHEKPNAWLDSAVDAVMLTPSAQSERKKGKWEIYIISMLDGEGCKCSECGFEGAPYWDYCPNCGARMDGGESDA